MMPNNAAKFSYNVTQMGKHRECRQHVPDQAMSLWKVTGDARAKVRTTYQGLQYENGDLNVVINKQHDDQTKWI